MNINASNDWYEYKDLWNACLSNSQNIKYNRSLIFPFVTNTIHTSGEHSHALKTYLDICANENQKEYNNINNWSLPPKEYQIAIGNINSYYSVDNIQAYNYSRQISFYANEFFNNNLRLEKYNLETNNKIIFSLKKIKKVFVKIISKLSYRDYNNQLNFISTDTANKALTQAIDKFEHEEGKIPHELSFSNTIKTGKQQRIIIYKIISYAISNLAEDGNIDFTQTYQPTTKKKASEVEYRYPKHKGEYSNGTIINVDNKKYKCLIAEWCNSDNPAYTPQTGFAAGYVWKNI